MFGIAIQSSHARDAIEQIVVAERLGIDSAWATMYGGGGGDLFPFFAAAAVQTSRIRLGTAIVHTWGRHPVTFAQEALTMDQLAPGRFLLGIGSTTQFFVERLYGMEYQKPLTNLREYLIVVRALLRDGQAEFAGEHVRTRARIRGTANVPVLGSALGIRSFELCGAESDGAISWMCARTYITDQAIPAVRRAAFAAGRPVAPPIVAHVPIAVNMDREAAHALARIQLASYAKVPNYQRMFALAGHDVADGYSDELLDDLIVYGSPREVASGLRRWREAGVGEVLAQPLVPVGDDGMRRAAFEAVAIAAREK